MDELINGQYMEAAMIGQGAFGQIFVGQDKQTKKLVAIKKESSNCKSPQLAFEYKIYKCLEGGMGIPKVYYQKDDKNGNVMVMDLLGPSLEDMFNYCDRRFSVHTVLMLGIELLVRLEFIHHRNFIHRDIKPDNFALGLSNRANVLYVLDFGLAKRYRTPGTKEHIPYCEKKCLTGTPRYASINNHQGIEQSRRDDLESLGYVLIYFLKGHLPWQGLAGHAKKQKYELIMKCKMETPLDKLCQDIPGQFLEYMTYCRKLGFDQAPDYRYLRRLFKNALEERNLRNDGSYDWCDLNKKFNDAKLPKHCRNTTSGSMLIELKFPAPAEYRETYKEKEYIRSNPANNPVLLRNPVIPHNPPTLPRTTAIPRTPAEQRTTPVIPSNQRTRTPISNIHRPPGNMGSNPLQTSYFQSSQGFASKHVAEPNRVQPMYYMPPPAGTYNSYIRPGVPRHEERSRMRGVASAGENTKEPFNRNRFNCCRMSDEEPGDLMEIRNRVREGVVVRNPDKMSVQIKQFNDHLYVNLCSEIAEWMSKLMKVTISPDLSTSLADGIYLCRLLDEFIPGGKLKKYNKNADKIPAYAHDNIHIFSTKCKELGIRGNYVLNVSHFEKKQIKEIVGCILLLAFFGKQKKMEHALPALDNSAYKEVMPTASSLEPIEEEEEKEVSDMQMWISLGVVALTFVMTLFNLCVC